MAALFLHTIVRPRAQWPHGPPTPTHARSRARQVADLAYKSCRYMYSSEFTSSKRDRLFRAAVAFIVHYSSLFYSHLILPWPTVSYSIGVSCKSADSISNQAGFSVKIISFSWDNLYTHLTMRIWLLIIVCYVRVCPILCTLILRRMSFNDQRCNIVEIGFRDGVILLSILFHSLWMSM